MNHSNCHFKFHQAPNGFAKAVRCQSEHSLSIQAITQALPFINITNEPPMLHIFRAHNPISSSHVSFCCPFPNSNPCYIRLITNIGVQLRRMTTTHALHVHITSSQSPETLTSEHKFDTSKSKEQSNKPGDAFGGHFTMSVYQSPSFSSGHGLPIHIACSMSQFKLPCNCTRAKTWQKILLLLF